jgi:hypothetical protein
LECGRNARHHTTRHGVRSAPDHHDERRIDGALASELELDRGTSRLPWSDFHSKPLAVLEDSLGIRDRQHVIDRGTLETDHHAFDGTALRTHALGGEPIAPIRSRDVEAPVGLDDADPTELRPLVRNEVARSQVRKAGVERAHDVLRHDHDPGAGRAVTADLQVGRAGRRRRGAAERQRDSDAPHLHLDLDARHIEAERLGIDGARFQTTNPGCVVERAEELVHRVGIGGLVNRRSDVPLRGAAVALAPAFEHDVFLRTVDRDPGHVVGTPDREHIAAARSGLGRRDAARRGDDRDHRGERQNDQHEIDGAAPEERERGVHDSPSRRDRFSTDRRRSMTYTPSKAADPGMYTST